MALGRVTNIKWIQDGKIFAGNYCTAQGKPTYITRSTDENVWIGTIQQLGETGSAMVTTVSALIKLLAVAQGD